MKIKAILFDKDGTLFHFNDTWGPWFYNILIQLSKGDDNLINKLSHLLKFNLNKKIFEYGSPFISGTEGETIKIINQLIPSREKTELLHWLSSEALKVDGVPVNELLKTLQKLDEMCFVMGVATNDSEIGAYKQLEKNKIKGFFKFIYGYDSGFGSKPETGMQEEFLRVTKFKPKEIAMVGDSMADIISGNKIGMHTIGVLTGPVERKILSNSADKVLNSIAEIPKYLNAINSL